MTDTATLNWSGPPVPSYAEFIQAWPTLTPAHAHSEAWRAETWKALTEDRVKLFASDGAAVLAGIQAAQNDRHVFVGLTGGPSILVNRLLDDVALWAQANDCTSVVITAAPEAADSFEGFFPVEVRLRRPVR